MRVGIVVHGGQGWLGGRNYIRNLLSAVYNFRDREIEPVLLTGTSDSDQLSDLPPFKVVNSSLFDQRSITEFTRKAVTAAFGRNWMFENLLRKHRIAALSHSGHLGARASIPTFGWIPDFQLMYLPDLQTDSARASRERKLLRICSNCTKVIVSSECARDDLKQFAPAFAHKGEVLRFVAAPFAREPITPADELTGKYQLDGPFFLLPNQFWAHKNHRTVIRALKVLRDRGRRVTVLATGSTRDHRNPAFFYTLMDYANQCGVLEDFRVLGIVPYEDLAGFMKSAVALINPSLFEGWSTSVEEAKTAGKAIVLSDIPVHREQAPERGIFFAPQDPEALADALIVAYSSFAPDADAGYQERALAEFPERQRQFARDYQGIVLSSPS